MATRAQALGVNGVVIDGQLRDVEYIRSLGIPVHRTSDRRLIRQVFAKGISIVGAGAECRARQDFSSNR